MKRYIKIRSREISGVLLLDKPPGMSSNFVVNIVKKFFWVDKAGHTGTLDPIATGILPICFGKATKLSRYFLNFDKKYRVIAQLGKSTDTFDIQGKIIRISTVLWNYLELKKCVQSFQGQLKQIPPMFSAVKYHGVPLYKYARKGINISRKIRKVYIYSIYLLHSIGNLIVLDIHCSKGTYIRSIVNELGERLGCGACVVSLRRTSIGLFNTLSTVKLKALENIFYSNVFKDDEVLRKLDLLLISIDTAQSLLFHAIKKC